MTVKNENRCDAEMPEGPRRPDPRCNNPGEQTFSQEGTFSGEVRTILLCDAHAQILGFKGGIVTRHSSAPARNLDGSVKRKERS